MKKETKLGKICVVSYPCPTRTKAWMHLFTVVRILESLSQRLCIITGNIPEDQIPQGKFRLTNFRMEPELRRDLPIIIALPMWLYSFVSGQIKTFYYLLRVSRHTDTVLFFLGADVNLLPMLLSKLLGKKVITMVAEYSPMSIKSVYGVFPYYIYKLLAAVNRRLSNRIIVYTENVIQWAKLEKYINKVSVTGEVFINTDLFCIKEPYAQRKNTIGYISRLTAEKGIFDFADAIPLILRHRNDVDFLIGGDGISAAKVREKLAQNGLMERITFANWIPHDELPDYMNKLKLLVMPTHTEAGSPQVLQESMSCGTPVLATPVGGIGDVVKDKENGFILKDHSPQRIAEAVLAVLEYPGINGIIKSGRKLIEKEYSFEAVAERFKKAFIGAEETQPTVDLMINKREA